MSAASNINHIEDATTSRWLTSALKSTQRHVKEGPTGEAIDRIRAQVFGDAAAHKSTRSVAA